MILENLFTGEQSSVYNNIQYQSFLTENGVTEVDCPDWTKYMASDEIMYYHVHLSVIYMTNRKDDLRTFVKFCL